MQEEVSERLIYPDRYLTLTSLKALSFLLGSRIRYEVVESGTTWMKWDERRHPP